MSAVFALFVLLAGIAIGSFGRCRCECHVEEREDDFDDEQPTSEVV